jgi:uncharacterized protein (TIGR02246 family)
METDEEQIRDLIERWAAAVHAGDMEAVLADHADDIVMFDVPPPQDGVRGIDAYRETWPPFFEWQAQGAIFEIVSLEVTAADDVAYAHALLRCAKPQELAARPDKTPAADARAAQGAGPLGRCPRASLVPDRLIRAAAAAARPGSLGALHRFAQRQS